jgi:mannose-6-phosphate isomerase-like protein (cupin superfamily)
MVEMYFFQRDKWFPFLQTKLSHTERIQEHTMPLIKYQAPSLPGWCELKAYEIVDLPKGAGHKFIGCGQKQKLIVGAGSCHLQMGEDRVTAEEGANLDLASAMGAFEVVEVLEETVLIFMCGDWGDETGGSGLFKVEQVADAIERGDPVNYPKETALDNHYHDCDEYWIIFQGRGVAVSEGKHYEVGPGDCVATGMGHHHDFPIVYEPVRAVYIETSLEGEKRRGHLWDHTHGPAQPKHDRV